MGPAAESLDEATRRCYSARLVSARNAQDYEAIRDREYVLDQVAFNSYINYHNWRHHQEGHDPDIPESLDSLVLSLESWHDHLKPFTLSDRYFTLVGEAILPRDSPNELWKDFFSDHEAAVGKAAADNNFSSIASELSASFAEYCTSKLSESQRPRYGETPVSDL